MSWAHAAAATQQALAPAVPLPPARTLTHQVHVGNVAVGGDAPVSVQSMTNTPTTDPAATLAQIELLAAAGCEIIRVAVPTKAALDGFGRICAESPLPVVADIHFDHRLAIAAAAAGASALRINPGNIGDMAKVNAVIDAAGEAGIPIRIGVNAGSLAPEVDAREDLTQPQKLVYSARAFVEHFYERGFRDVVVSAKTHGVIPTVLANRELARVLPEVPLHLGVTEAGSLVQGTVKNTAALSLLLAEGIGSTLRISLTEPPEREVEVAWDLLSALELRRRGPELVSCPSCGRCQIDLIALAHAVEERLHEVKAPISVAVMGCTVNGPGEARHADIGVAGGRGQGMLFAHGEQVRVVQEDTLVDELMAEIHARFEGAAPTQKHLG